MNCFWLNAQLWHCIWMTKWIRGVPSLICSLLTAVKRICHNCSNYRFGFGDETLHKFVRASASVEKVHFSDCIFFSSTVMQLYKSHLGCKNKNQSISCCCWCGKWYLFGVVAVQSKSKRLNVEVELHGLQWFVFLLIVVLAQLPNVIWEDEKNMLILNQYDIIFCLLSKIQKGWG